MYGSGLPADIWKSTMDKALVNAPNETFPQASGLGYNTSPSTNYPQTPQTSQAPTPSTQQSPTRTLITREIRTVISCLPQALLSQVIC